MAVSFKNENSFNFFATFSNSLIFCGRPTPLKSVAMATRDTTSNFEFQNFTNAYLGKVTKFQFNCFSRLGAALKKPEGGGRHPPSPIRVNWLLKDLLNCIGSFSCEKV